MSQKTFDEEFLDTSQRIFEDFVTMIERLDEKTLRHNGDIVWSADEIGAIFDGAISPKMDDLAAFLDSDLVQKRRDDFPCIATLQAMLEQFMPNQTESAEILPATTGAAAPPTVEQVAASNTPTVSSDWPTSTNSGRSQTMTGKLRGRRKEPVPFTLEWGGETFTFDLSDNETRSEVGQRIVRFKGDKTNKELSMAMYNNSSSFGGLLKGGSALTAAHLKKVAALIGVEIARLLLDDDDFNAGNGRDRLIPLSEDISAITPVATTEESATAQAVISDELPADTGVVRADDAASASQEEQPEDVEAGAATSESTPQSEDATTAGEEGREVPVVEVAKETALSAASDASVIDYREIVRKLAARDMVKSSSLVVVLDHPDDMSAWSGVFEDWRESLTDEQLFTLITLVPDSSS